MTLDELAEDRARKGQVFKALGAVNTSGRSTEEQIKLDVAYERAKREYQAADAAYYQAIRAAAA